MPDFLDIGRVRRLIEEDGPNIFPHGSVVLAKLNAREANDGQVVTRVDGQTVWSDPDVTQTDLISVQQDVDDLADDFTVHHHDDRYYTKFANDALLAVKASTTSLLAEEASRALSDVLVRQSLDDLREDFEVHHHDNRYGTVAVACTKSGAQSPGTGSWTPIAFDAADTIDTHGMHDIVTNNTRITCVIPGYYVFTGTGAFTANATGFRAARIIKSTGAVLAITDMSTNSADIWAASVASVPVWMNVGEYVTLDVYQNGAATLALSSSFCVFGAYRIGHS